MPETTALTPTIDSPPGTVLAPPGAAPQGADAILAIVAACADKGVPAETFAIVQGLYERSRDRAAAEEFARALAEFQGDCPAIDKNRETDYTTKAGGRVHYKYATLDQIAAGIRGPLSSRGFSYSWDATVANGSVKVVCTLRHANGHRETSTFEAAVDRESKMNPTQQVGAALTYGKRYSLISVLGLSTAEDDTDALPPRAATGRHAPAASAAPAGEAPPPAPAPALVTEEQAATIDGMIAEVGADGPSFFKWLGVKNAAAIPAGRYVNAVKALEAKRAAPPKAAR